MIRLNSPFQHAQQRCLARAIAAKQADSLTGVNLSRDTIEQYGSAKSNGNVVDRDQRHTVAKGR